MVRHTHRRRNSRRRRQTRGRRTQKGGFSFSEFFGSSDNVNVLEQKLSDLQEQLNKTQDQTEKEKIQEKIQEIQKKIDLAKAKKQYDDDVKKINARDTTGSNMGTQYGNQYPNKNQEYGNQYQNKNQEYGNQYQNKNLDYKQSENFDNSRQFGNQSGAGSHRSRRRHRRK